MSRFTILEGLIDRMVEREGVPAAGIALGLGQEIIFERYAGEAAPGRDVSPETLWPLASISKLYTAAAVTALVESGVLSLAQKISTDWPEFTGGGLERITLRQVLTHSAGLEYESSRMVELLIAQTPLHAMLDEVIATPLRFPPGTDQHYSDWGYAVAARVASIATGTPFPELVSRHVLRGADLAETFMPLPRSEYPRLAYVSGAFAEGTAGAMYNADYALQLAHPAFGTVATARDLARFGQCFLSAPDRPFLSRAGVMTMTTDQTGGDFPAEACIPVAGIIHPWGLGFMLKGRTGTPELVSPASFGHGGASGCILWVEPVEQITIAFVSNRHLNHGFDDFLFRLDRVVNVAMACLTR